MKHFKKLFIDRTITPIISTVPCADLTRSSQTKAGYDETENEAQPNSTPGPKERTFVCFAVDHRIPVLYSLSDWSLYLL
jgi:hypothetical protein